MTDLAPLRREPDIEQLLPHYVSEALSVEDRWRVEAYLERTPQARAEVAFLRRVRQGKARSAARAAGRLGSVRPLRAVIPAPKPVRSRWPTVLMVATVLVAAALAMTFYATPRQQAEVKLASGPVADLQVMFSPTATEAEIRDLLHDIGAEIVAGPSALGVYRIDVRASAADAAVLKQAVGTLRAAINVVSFAELEAQDLGDSFR